MRLSTSDSISVSDSRPIALDLAWDSLDLGVCVLGFAESTAGLLRGVIDFCGETRLGAMVLESLGAGFGEESGREGGVMSRACFRGEIEEGAAGGLENGAFWGVIERGGVRDGDFPGAEVSSWAR